MSEFECETETLAYRQDRRYWLDGEKVLFVIFLIPLLALICALVWRSTLMAPINFNEGWNAYWAKAAATGHRLYLPWRTLRANNYPPLSFYIVALLTKIIPDAIYAGRIISWISFAGIGCLIYLILRVCKNDRLASLFGAMVFYAYMTSQNAIYVGADDPQMLAHFVECAGLFLFLVNSGSQRSIFTAAIIIVFGLFVKHNIVALPVSLAIWLFFVEKRNFYKFVLSVGLFGFIGLIFCQLYFGQNFLPDLLIPRQISIKMGAHKMFHWLMPMQAPLIVIFLEQFPGFRDKRAVLFGIYTVIALVVASLEATGSGVSINATFEIVIAFSLGFGHFVGGFERYKAENARLFRCFSIGITGVSLLFWSVAFNVENPFVLSPWIHKEKNKAEISRMYVKNIQKTDGPVICEDLAICYWAGKNNQLSFFNLSQYTESKATKIAAHDVSKKLRSKYFSAVQMHYNANTFLQKSIEGYYVLSDHSRAFGNIYIPKK